MMPRILGSWVPALCTVTWVISQAWVPAHAATFTVTNTADSGGGSLRQAILDAGPGDSIDFAVTGTILLTSGELVVSKNLTISGPAASDLTISGNGASRVFNISQGATVEISRLTATAGMAAECCGGAVRNTGNLTLRDTVVSASNAQFGGGIFNDESAALTVTGGMVDENTAQFGGGIYNLRGSLIMADSLVANNTASKGGESTATRGSLR